MLLPLTHYSVNCLIFAARSWRVCERSANLWIPDKNSRIRCGFDCLVESGTPAAASKYGFNGNVDCPPPAACAIPSDVDRWSPSFEGQSCPNLCRKRQAPSFQVIGRCSSRSAILPPHHIQRWNNPIGQDPRADPLDQPAFELW